MIGIAVNVLAVALGGLLGTVCKDWLSKHIIERLNLVFGICAIGMGIKSVIVIENMPPVILAAVLGTLIGAVLHLSDLIAAGAGMLRVPIKLVTREKSHLGGMHEEEVISELMTVVMLFCFSCTGIYGSLEAGVTGDCSILLSKSVLDFFTALIFACKLGPVVTVVAAPQLILLVAVYSMALFIYPLTTPVMIADFKGCGGLLLLATGFRVARIQDFPVLDMLPAMILVMPLSNLWSECLMPFLL